MTLHIQWHVLPGPFNGYQKLVAGVIHDGVWYAKEMAMPASFSKATWWLIIAAMKAEIENAIKNPPAD
jgi:TPR repeat protein